MPNKNFRYIDDWAVIRLADSFVKINKAGNGNGEAALYLGSKYDSDIFNFFGCENFNVHCLMLKSEIIDYLNDVKLEYVHNRKCYRNEVSINTWQQNMDEAMQLPEELYFDLTRKRQFDKHGRVYAQELTYRGRRKDAKDDGIKAYTYDIIRRFAIPEVTFLMLSKLEGYNGYDFSAKFYYDPNFE